MPLNPAVANRSTGVVPPGRPGGFELALLDRGADVLQTTAPLAGFDVYVVGFHCVKGKPDLQMEAHHFCKVVNADMLQCVLFDGNTRDANLIGIEYIVSEALYGTLPEEERAAWHPHNHEVFSGELVAPGLPVAIETELMGHLVNSYGKTWHTWHSTPMGEHPAQPLPLGDPMLMWSFNREGEVDEALRRDRNAAMHTDPEPRKASRAKYLDRAHPQRGVGTMRDAFSGTSPTPGVVDAQDGRP
ncbi:OBAP family protein [Curtobacterium sp. MCBD17_003]|uniref:OBAP family protein n=1 Tax=Curtobacterium sp. MCBD17_003 TaxID=2175667 RepID=UPI0021ABA9C0|nr:OBAP family protein [Curtobacterium sp. MCBD17_003]WIE53971.1 OBAP family protein [Curtobacterium sp. MCBD17_003]